MLLSMDLTNLRRKFGAQNFVDQHRLLQLMYVYKSTLDAKSGSIALLRCTLRAREGLSISHETCQLNAISEPDRI